MVVGSTPSDTPGGTVGQVSVGRYQQLVERVRELVEQHRRVQFEVGDIALEIEPMQQVGGSSAADEAFTVRASLQRLADDTGIPFSTIRTRRWVASRWPVERRRAGVSFGVHKILASISDEQQRWARIGEVPVNERTGRRQWTEDAAHRVVGQQVNHPVTAQEKVTAIHDLAADEQVAATAVTDLLRRPDVAFKAMGDHTARHLVNRAQVDRSQQAARAHRAPAAPALDRLQRSGQFLDLVAACSAFVSAVGRVMPTLRGHEFSQAERDAVHAQLARVRATADWIETGVDTGKLDLDAALAELLRGER